MPIEHIASSTDCIDSIAHQHGVLPSFLWDHPDNSVLRERRGSPHLLMLGDMVVVPDVRPIVHARATEQTHTFVRKAVPARMKVRILRHGEPVANTPWTLEVDDVRHEGSTDGEGVVEVPISPRAVRATLRVHATPDPLVYELTLGALDPGDEITGLQQRLRNLGYSVPTEELGALLEQTRAALRRFQVDHHLEPTGEPDEATQSALLAAS